MSMEAELDRLLERNCTDLKQRARIKKSWQQGDLERRIDSLALLKKRARTVQDGTLENAMRIYKRLMSLDGPKKLSALRPQHVQKFIAVKKWPGSRRHRGPQTRRTDLTDLRKLYEESCQVEATEPAQDVLQAIEDGKQAAGKEIARLRADETPTPGHRLSRAQRQTILDRANAATSKDYQAAATAFIVNRLDENGGRFAGLDMRRVSDTRFYEGRPSLIESDRGAKKKRRRDWAVRQAPEAYEWLLRHHPCHDEETDHVPGNALLLPDWELWAQHKIIHPLQDETLRNMWTDLGRGLKLQFLLGPRAFRRFRTTSRSVQDMPPDQIRRLCAHSLIGNSRIRYTIYDEDDALEIRGRLDFDGDTSAPLCPRCHEEQPTHAVACATCRVPLDETIMPHLAQPAYWQNERIGRFGLRMVEIKQQWEGQSRGCHE